MPKKTRLAKSAKSPAMRRWNPEKAARLAQSLEGDVEPSAHNPLRLKRKK